MYMARRPNVRLATIPKIGGIHDDTSDGYLPPEYRYPGTSIAARMLPKGRILLAAWVTLL